jgi:membrane protease YdiL (CAAX protease family)
MKRSVALWIELVCVYLAVPMLIYERILPNWPIPFLLLALAWALLVLHRDTTFDRRVLMQHAGVGPGLRAILRRDVPLLLLLGLMFWLATPRLLFSLIKSAPMLWLLVMILYPVFSVYPQELLYRAYFYHRYKPLFGNGAGMIAVSAFLFGFVHIIFGNWISMTLTAIGGFLFGLTYRKSGSLLLACLEHALFGDFIFTIGMGHYFYHLAGRQ